MNTEKIDIKSFQILSQESSVKLEKDKGRDAVDLEQSSTATDPALLKINIAIRPKCRALDALIHHLKVNYISYRLTPLIKLFLEKKDRFEIFLTALSPDVLFGVKGNNLPFLSKEKAFNSLIEKQWSDIFEQEVSFLNPVRGHFTSINRCGITDVLLGPPNYHLYNDLIKEHYLRHLAQDYSWEFFIQQIKNEHDLELIKQWQKEMSKSIVFRLKADPKICFYDRYSALSYLQEHPYLFKGNIKHFQSMSLSYAEIEKIEDAFLKNQIYQKLNDEFRLPISLGCFCRMRFRHAGLYLYRRRNKIEQTSFVCPIKRRVRSEEDPLPDEWIRILDYIEQHPMVNIKTCLADLCGKIQQSETSISNEKLLWENLIKLTKLGYVMQFENGSLYTSPHQKSPKSHPKNTLDAATA